jgi:protein-S-isoprenylcysteine O-methyltransferase Ste14
MSRVVEVAAASGRPNATAGVYGRRVTIWFPLALFSLVLGAYWWRRGGGWQWTELAWFVAAVLQMVIRWPHVQRNRSNQAVGRRVGRLEQWLMLVVFLTLCFVPMVYLATPWFDRLDYTVPAPVSAVAAMAMVLSLWLFHLSHAQLGRNWSPSLEIRQEHSLVTTGVYARVRHPMYSSIWLFALAQPFLVQNWLAGALAVPGFALLYFLRVNEEERLMLDSFGQEYRAYMARTGRLWPRLGAAA